jgi:hypothetical protein
MKDGTLALLLSPATWALSSVTGIVVGVEDVDLFGPSSQQQVQFEGYDADCFLSPRSLRRVGRDRPVHQSWHANFSCGHLNKGVIDVQQR